MQSNPGQEVKSRHSNMPTSVYRLLSYIVQIVQNMYNRITKECLLTKKHKHYAQFSKLDKPNRKIGTNSARSIAIQCELIFTNVRGKGLKKAFHVDHIGLISKLYNGLHNQGQLTDFLNLAQGLLDGKIKWHNMAWTGALHMGRLSACTTTCNMKYDKHYVDFFCYFVFTVWGFMSKCTKRLTSLQTSGFG